MKRFLFMLLLNFRAVSTEMVRIQFSDTDGSYAVDGTKFDESTTLIAFTIYDQILVQSWFESQAETDFTLSDGTKTVSSKDLKADEFFGSNLIIEMPNNTNFRWALVFRQVTREETDTFPETKRDLFYLDEITSYQVSVNPDNVTYYVTFVHTLGYEYPQLFVWPYVDDSSPDCEMRVYPRGIPSPLGASKYQLMTFRQHDPTVINFAQSAVLSFAATVEVPPGCSGSIWATKLENWDFNTVILDDVPVHEGFVMSQGYPNFWIQNSGYTKQRPIQTTFEVSDDWQNRDTTRFLIDVVTFKPGDGEGFLQVTVGDGYQLNLTSSVSELNFEVEGSKLEVVYKSSKGDGELLLQFSAQVPLEKSTTEHTTTRGKTTRRITFPTFPSLGTLPTLPTRFTRRPRTTGGSSSTFPTLGTLPTLSTRFTRRPSTTESADTVSTSTKFASKASMHALMLLLLYILKNIY